MSLSFLNSLCHQFVPRWPVLICAATWTMLLTVTVAITSFLPELAFVSAISMSSSFSQACGVEGAIRVPLDLPGEVMCLPAHLFGRSKIDLIVPPLFAAVVVAGSAWMVRAMSLWEVDDEAH